MDEQRDMTKLIVAFRDFAKAPKTRKIVALIDLFSWHFFPEYLHKIINTVLSVIYIYFVRFRNNLAKRDLHTVPLITYNMTLSLGSVGSVIYLRGLLFLCFIDILLFFIYFIRLV